MQPAAQSHSRALSHVMTPLRSSKWARIREGSGTSRPPTCRCFRLGLTSDAGSVVGPSKSVRTETINSAALCGSIGVERNCTPFASSRAQGTPAPPRHTAAATIEDPARSTSRSNGAFVSPQHTNSNAIRDCRAPRPIVMVGSLRGPPHCHRAVSRGRKPLAHSSQYDHERVWQRCQHLDMLRRELLGP